MGFKIPRKTARLVFEGEEFEGCEIIAALDITFAASEHMDELLAAKDSKGHLAFFAENVIISWNLEDAEGKPIPISGEALLQFPSWFALLIINGWKQAIDQVVGVSAPLVEPSPNGQPSEAPPEMTEASSSVPESSATPS